MSRDPEAAAPRNEAPSALPMIAVIGGFQVFAMLFGLIRSKVIALTVGPQGVGAISVVDQLVALVAQVSALGLPFASVKLLSAAHSSHTTDGGAAFQALYRSFLRWLLLLSGAGVALAALLLWLAPGVLGSEIQPYRSLVVLGLLAVPATSIAGLVTNAFAASRQAYASAAFGLAMSFALVALCCVGLLAGGLTGYYAGALAANVAVVLCGAVWLSREMKRPEARGPQPSPRLGEITRFAAAMSVIAVTTPLAFLAARFAVLAAGGFELAGILQSAMGLGLTLTTVMRSSLSLFLLPAMNRHADPVGKIRDAASFLRAFSLIVGVAALPMVLFPGRLMTLLYSKSFLAAAPHVYLFVLAEALLLFAGVNQAVVVGVDHVRVHVAICLAGHLAIVCLSLGLVPRLGIDGVAAAFLANGFLIFTLTAWRLRARHGVSIVKEAGWLPFAVLSLVAVGGIFASHSHASTAAEIAIRAGFIAAFCALSLRSGLIRLSGQLSLRRGA
jgi:O-antigen/teichoic acid export membrane protein